jgi:hypothetical protein
MGGHAAKRGFRAHLLRFLEEHFVTRAELRRRQA